jgi:hypothetical protein
MQHLLRCFCLAAVLILPMEIWADSANNHAASQNCFGSLRDILSAGGYTGGLDCSEIHVHIKKVGVISVSSDSYVVYDLRYKTVPVEGGSAHGGQRIIIVLNSKEYLGQFILNTPPMRHVTIVGNSIFIDVSADQGNEIKIGKNGPPSSAFLDQDVKEFYK